MPKFTNTRAAQQQATTKAARDKLMIHASERVATRAIEMLEKAIEANTSIELAIVQKLDGDQILKREERVFSFAERVYTDMKDMITMIQMAQMGFTAEDESKDQDWSEDLKAM